jgi:hypothetical protein
MWDELLDQIIEHCSRNFKKHKRIKAAHNMLQDRGYDCKIKKCSIGDTSFYFLEMPNLYIDTIVQVGYILLVDNVSSLIGELALRQGMATIKIPKLFDFSKLCSKL